MALWQANQHIGATLVNEPGTLNWNELITTDPAAPAFYQHVVGLTTSTMDMAAASTRCSRPTADGGRYHPAADAGHAQSLACVLRRRRRGRHGAKATELGGSVLVPPFDTPVGRMAVIVDPQGAVFSIIQRRRSPPRRRAGESGARGGDTQAQRGRQAVLPVADPRRPRVEIKPMFGNLGAFVHGNMFAGLFGSAVGVRLAEAGRQRTGGHRRSAPFGPDGHAMAGYISLPVVWRDDAGLPASWVDKARDHVGIAAAQGQEAEGGQAEEAVSISRGS